MSESGSSETGHCSNVSDSGRVCNAPRSSVLFDGIPTLTGLEGDMWASELLTLNTSTSSASITFDFTNPTDRNGPTNYAGVSVIEVVMFNCFARGTGTYHVQVTANGRIVDFIAVSESCDYLVRLCSVSFVYPSYKFITLSFQNIYSTYLYIAEITFYSSSSRQCSPVGPLNTSVVRTTRPTMKVSTPSISTQDEPTTTNSNVVTVLYTSDSSLADAKENNITEDISTKYVACSPYSNTELANMTSSNKNLSLSGWPSKF